MNDEIFSPPTMSREDRIDAMMVNITENLEQVAEDTAATRSFTMFLLIVVGIIALLYGGFLFYIFAVSPGR